MRATLLGLLVLGWAATAQAQVANPTAVQFTPSVDDAVVTRYELRLYLSGAALPFSVHDLGKPAPVNGTITVVNAAWFVGVANGTLCVARVAAFDAEGREGLSEPSNTWTRDVLPPAKGPLGLDPW